MFQLAVDLEASPRVTVDSELVGTVMFSNQRVEKFDDREPEFLQDLAENPRVQQIRGKIRTPTHEGKPVPKMKAYNVRDAIFEAMLHRFAIDPTMIAFGEENRDWGGAFAVYRGLTEALPYHRLFNSPISEAAIVGAAVGYALEGGRVVAELMYADFMGRAGDEIFNQLSKWQAMSAGQLHDAGGAAHLGGLEVRRAALAGLDRAGASHPRTEGGLPGDAVRRQGHDERGAGRHRSGDLLREPEGLRLRRDVRRARACRRATTKSNWASRRSSARATDLTIITLGPALYTAIAAADELQSRIRPVGRGDRPARRHSAELRAARRVGAQDRQGAAGVAMRWSAAASCTPSPRI